MAVREIIHRRVGVQQKIQLLATACVTRPSRLLLSFGIYFTSITCFCGSQGIGIGALAIANALRRMIRKLGARAESARGLFG